MKLEAKIWQKTKADGAMAKYINRTKGNDLGGKANKLGVRAMRLKSLGRIHTASSMKQFDEIVKDLDQNIVGAGRGKFLKPSGEIRDMFRYLSKDLEQGEHMVECWFILDDTAGRLKEAMIVDADMKSASLIHHWKQDTHGADYRWTD